MDFHIRCAEINEIHHTIQWINAVYQQSGKKFLLYEDKLEKLKYFIAENNSKDIVASACIRFQDVFATASIESFAVASAYQRKGIGTRFLQDLESKILIEYEKPIQFLSFVADSSPNMETWAKQRHFYEYSGGYFRESNVRYIIYRKNLIAPHASLPDIMGDFLSEVTQVNAPQEMEQDKNAVFASLLTNLSQSKLQAIADCLDSDAEILDGEEAKFVLDSPELNSEPEESLDDLVLQLMTQLKDPQIRRPLFEGTHNEEKQT